MIMASVPGVLLSRDFTFPLYRYFLGGLLPSIFLAIFFILYNITVNLLIILIYRYVK